MSFVNGKGVQFLRMEELGRENHLLMNHRFIRKKTNWIVLPGERLSTAVKAKKYTSQFALD